MAQHDVVIRGGLVVDGSGGEPFGADVAVDGDTIVAVGPDVGAGRRTVEADGRLVTPGFVDSHTHLDAQLAWDASLTPSSWHGVTTVLIGNCGMTFAPVRPGGAGFLAEVMEAVEDIPRSIILDALPWDWESYGDYLDYVDRTPLALNVAGMIGHAALRVYVMGERAFGGEARPEEVDEMAAIVGEAMAAGAVGFSTSRLLSHVVTDGRAVPGTYAPYDELLRFAAVMGEAGGGLFQNVLDFFATDGEELGELLRKEAEACGRALFSIAVLDDPTMGRLSADLMASRFAGLDVTASCIPRGSGSLSGLQGVVPYRAGAWAELADAAPAVRLAMVDDPATFARLEADAATEAPTWPLTWYRPLGDGPSPAYVGQPHLVEMAEAAGEHPATTWLRVARESRGKALFNVEFFNRSYEALGDLLSSDRVLPGLGDAGAHVGQVMDAGWTTYVLSHWVRDTGRLGLGDAVRRITARPAEVVGAHDRGRVAPGYRADLNVVDLDGLAVPLPELVFDLPGGAKRFVQRAQGYGATLVNGTVILADDELTGDLPGRVVRPGR